MKNEEGKLFYNGWGLTKFKKYQMKKIKEAFFKFCLSPCYPSVPVFSFFLGREILIKFFKN